MEDLMQLIIVEGDILSTVIRLALVGLSMDLVLGFASLIGESKK